MFLYNVEVNQATCSVKIKMYCQDNWAISSHLQFGASFPASLQALAIAINYSAAKVEQKTVGRFTFRDIYT